MAYTAKDATKTLFGYLGLNINQAIFIDRTNKRGFIYKQESGEECVIFIYPVSHKADDSKNFFDTRDSGAYERGVAWNYALEKKLKYFCFAVHDQVTRYKDYVFSLECNEKTIEEVSGTKDGVRAGKGTQVVIPNDYTPSKDFDRIKTKNGFFISIIHKNRIKSYIAQYDNRPYLLDNELIDLELLEQADSEDEGIFSADDQKEHFRTWMKSQKKADGNPYSENTINSYISQMQNGYRTFDNYRNYQTCFDIQDVLELNEYMDYLFNADGFDEFNNSAGNKACSYGFVKYAEFLSSNKAPFKASLKNCMEVILQPRTNKIHPLNFIIYGAPGTGKTYSTAEYALAIVNNREVDLSSKTDEQRKSVLKEYKDYIKKGQVVFTTFHQNYGYEEFIQGLRPDPNSEGISFNTVDGIFKKIADIALGDENNNYVIIIDEINRANISKVFGELITLIEEDKRWGELNESCATLQSGDVFAVPNNLYIVGTMNSADKSISLIDAALRRRFSFIEQKPDDSLVGDATLKRVFTTLNERLVTELDSTDLLIGHSYFMNKEKEELSKILNTSIIPLLYEYFYDNRKKVASILAEAIKNTDVEIVDDKIGRLSVKNKG